MKRYVISVLLVFAAKICLAAGPNYVLREAADGTSILSQSGTEFGFFMPETGGYLKTGLILGEKSLWLANAEKLRVEKQKRGWILHLKDPILGEGELIVRVLPLTDCNGLLLQVVGKKTPEDLLFLWAYGGGSAGTDPVEKRLFFQPSQCKDNVFSREINAFTIYYGSSMKLKVMMGVSPLNTEMRLSDARQVSSPLAFLNSGKKTNAPALSAANQIRSGEKYYYCIYRQNQKADYNYYMLPALYEKESTIKYSPVDEKVAPHTNFGPDFHQ
jgi:hypothetical protein